MRLWFIGSGPFAARCLEGLAAEGLPFERVITALPTRGGRGMKEMPSRVEERALALSLPLERTGPLSGNEALMDALREDAPDAAFVVDFGQRIREPLLSAPRWGCINIHPSLLPRWRGAAPIPRALMEGDMRTGVTVFRLVPEMDAGPVLRQGAVDLEGGVTASELYERLAALGAELAAEGLRELEAAGEDFSRLFAPQDGEPCCAAKLSKEEFHVSWDWPADRADRTIRALEALGGAFVMAGGKRLKLWRASPVDASGAPGTVVELRDGTPVMAFASGALLLLEVQAEGKKRSPASEWARGLRLKPGDALSRD